MAYESLYRRYRPRRFADVRGQDDVVRALSNAVREDRVGHAYLFSGPRGTGKTSTARILAKALNCTALDDGEPCCECESCVSIEAGTSYDLLELDAASNNGVDAMRDLIAKASLGSPGRTKVYILDEVHMLSTGASNALLKTLEEPPGHVVFVLATTDPHKVLPTIRSRTQHFELHLLPASELEKLVHYVVVDAELGVDDDGIAYALSSGGGSARDTLSALDQVVAAGGVLDRGDQVDDLVAALAARDTGAALGAVADAVRRGHDPRVVGEALLAKVRDIFLHRMGDPLGHLTVDVRAQVTIWAEQLSDRDCTRALETIGEALRDMRQATDARIPLEVALVRLTRDGADASLDALVARIERLERGGGAAPAAGGVAAQGVASDAPAGSGGTASRVASAAGSAGPDAPAPGSPGGASPDASTGAAPAPASPAPAQGAPTAPTVPAPAQDSSPAHDAAPPGSGRPLDAARALLAEKGVGAPKPARTAAPAPTTSTPPPATPSSAQPPPAMPSSSTPSSGGQSSGGQSPPAPPAPGTSSAPSTEPSAQVASPDQGAPGDRVSAEAPPAATASVAAGSGGTSAGSPDAATSVSGAATPAPTTAPGAPDAGPAATTTGTPTGGGLPSRGDLTAAWTEHVLPRLGGLTKAMYSVGTFEDTSGDRAVFSVPNAVHRDKSEQKRPEVEAALEAHFGHPVPLHLVIEGQNPAHAGSAVQPGTTPSVGDTTAPESSSQSGQPAQPTQHDRADQGPREADPFDEAEDIGDIDELEDAPADNRDSLARLQDAFPGAEIIEP